MKKKGFTLIELLVVVAIIGILATIILVSLGTVRAKARDTRRVADLRQVALALEMYMDDNNKYPGAVNTDSWDSGLPDLVSGGYLAALPVDPIDDTNHEYHYYVDSDTLNYILAAEGIEVSGSSLLNTDLDTCDSISNTACDCLDTGSYPIYCFGP